MGVRYLNELGKDWNVMHEVGKVVASPPTRILYPIKEAAVLLGISYAQIYTLISGPDPKLVTRWNGGKRVLHIDDINAFANALPTEKPDFTPAAVAA